MHSLSTPRYAEPNWELIERWLALEPEQDGPFLAFNLMRYRALAEYADGRATTMTGREADDAYAPLGPLRAVGAKPVLVADVTEQPAGEPRFERVAIVRYPSRRAFIEMQRLPEFRELHVHKEAGMEFTILFAADAPAEAPSPDGSGPLLLRLHSGSGDGRTAASLLALELDGVVLGDARRWQAVSLERLEDGQGSPSRAGRGEIVMVLGTPALADLAGMAR